MARLRRLHKKAQFYLFVAIMLCISAYGLLSTAPKPQVKNTDFDLMSKNYVHEADNVIDQAIYADGDAYAQVDAYTLNFISYAKTKNTDFKVLYILKEKNSTYIVNYLKKEANITTYGKALNDGEHSILPSNSSISIDFDDNEYDYNFTEDDFEFKALITK